MQEPPQCREGQTLLYYLPSAQPNGLPILEYQLNVSQNGVSVASRTTGVSEESRTDVSFDDELQFGASYEAQLRARNAAGWSSWSPSISCGTSLAADLAATRELTTAIAVPLSIGLVLLILAAFAIYWKRRRSIAAFKLRKVEVVDEPFADFIGQSSRLELDDGDQAVINPVFLARMELEKVSEQNRAERERAKRRQPKAGRLAIERNARGEIHGHHALREGVVKRLGSFGMGAGHPKHTLTLEERLAAFCGDLGVATHSPTTKREPPGRLGSKHAVQPSPGDSSVAAKKPCRAASGNVCLGSGPGKGGTVEIRVPSSRGGAASSGFTGENGDQSPQLAREVSASRLQALSRKAHAKGSSSASAEEFSIKF